MKVEDLVGKLAVRVRTVDTSSRYPMLMSESSQDASFTYDPVFVEAVEQGVAYIRTKPNGPVQILGARYRDENWCPVSERFTPDLWKPEPVEHVCEQIQMQTNHDTEASNES